MYTFAQKPKADQRTASAKTMLPARACFGQSHEMNSILHLQRKIGNRAVRRLLETTTPSKIRAKLTVSTPGDQYEREADQMADSVMAVPTRPMDPVSQGVQPKLYRSASHSGELGVRPEDLVDSAFPTGGDLEAGAVQTSPTEEVRRSATSDADAVTPHFEQSLRHAIHGGGQPLPSSSRSFMESRFGYDFSSVRVHSDDRAHRLAREINAHAFTLDKDIFFARSQYQPESREGQRLLAHELTHVVQQSEGRLSRQIQRLTACSSYGTYNASVDLLTYNCAGLATRTYRDIAPATAVYDSISANFTGAETPSGGNCVAGRVKFWLWEYDMHSEDDQGHRSATRRDFHVVAGRVDSNGADPTDVYSKNGHRRVYGPGTGPGFRPAQRERSLSNNPSETPISTPQGRPVFKVRSNMTEDITCAECS